MKQLVFDLSVLAETMVENGVVKSKSEWRRLIEQDGVMVREITLKVGKYKFFKIPVNVEK